MTVHPQGPPPEQPTVAPDRFRPGTGPADTTVAVVETPWRRLDPRMLAVGPLNGMVGLVPLVVVLLISGQGDLTRLWVAAVAGVLVVLAGVLRWRTTRYRITPDRVELHIGWLNRQRRSVPRDRIRTVDLTAKLLHRAFGLSVVQVGAGSGGPADEAGLSLDAVSKAEADRLRRELLAQRGGAAAAPGDAAGAARSTAVPVVPPARELARLDWAWLRYAPLTLSSLAGIGAVVAAVFNVAGDLGVDPRDIDAVDAAGERLAAAPVWLAVGGLGVLLLVVAALGSLLLFAERWWGYRLTREPDGTVRVKRGLLTRRSLSVSEQRLRGAELTEPLLLRAGRGAQCRALTTGLSGEGGGALLPPAPRAQAHRVASEVLREPPAEITAATLRRHPPAARVRRLTRALGPSLVLVAAAWVLTVSGAGPGWAGPVSLLLPPVALLLGVDRYRNLGHALTARYVVARSGSLNRRTAALQRAGVIGWTIRQSPFQRRAGLVTLTAVTAAGVGGYDVLDVGAADAVTLADAATPGLLARVHAH
ncbi:MAG TPA: PH domain-containing protein [Pseudonocardia sp.]|nr:PH domain-containing protein [Pseudonocardia sp.]